MDITSKPRALTVEECREKFLAHVAYLAEYWSWDRVQGRDTRSRVEGMAFSLLVVLDGGSCTLPGFTVCPSPHLDDEAYRRDQGDNWWPTGEDIGGHLHEEFHPMLARLAQAKQQAPASDACP